MGSYTYSHDARGNMTKMPHLQVMQWNALNELCAVRQGSTDAYYQYSSGQRMRKFTNKGNVQEERIYLGDFEIYRKYVSGVPDKGIQYQFFQKQSNFIYNRLVA